MKEELRTLARFVLRAALLIGIPALCVLFAPTAWYVLSPFVVALCIAASLQPVIRFAREKLRLNKKAAVFLTLFLLVTLLLLILYWFISFAVEQLLSAVTNAPDIINGIIAALQSLGERLLSSLEYVPATVADWLRTTFSNAAKWLYEQGVSFAGGLFSGTVNFALSLPGVLIYVNFLFLSICFMTADYEKIQRYFPKKNTVTPSGRLRESAVEGTIGFIKVQAIYTLFVFAVSWIYFQLFGFQYSVLLAGFAALLEFLPVFGNGTFYIPWLIGCFLLGETGKGVLILIVHLFLYLTRKLTEPRLMNRNMGLSPLMSLVTMFVGMRLGGVLGLTLAPIVGVVLVSAWRSGLFEPTIRDGRAVIENIKNRLAPRPDEIEQIPHKEEKIQKNKTVNPH